MEPTSALFSHLVVGVDRLGGLFQPGGRLACCETSELVLACDPVLDGDRDSSKLLGPREARSSFLDELPPS